MSDAPEIKVAKVFADASYSRLFNSYHFADLIRNAGAIPAAAMQRAAVGWFMLMEIEHRYGIGDPMAGEIGSRIVHEVLSDYEEIPDYNPGRGLEGGSGSTRGTWEGYEPNVAKTFIRRGADIQP